MTNNSDQEYKKITSIPKKTVVMVSVSIIGVCVVILSSLFYGGIDQNTPVQFLAQKIPLPVAIIGGAPWVWSSELIASQEAVRRSYERPGLLQSGVRIDFSTPDGQKRWNVVKKATLDKLIEDKVIIKMANDAGITVSQEAADQEISRRIKESDSEKTVGEYEKEIFDRYGWSLETMRDRVVIPELYTKRLYEQFAQDKNEHGEKEKEAQKIRALIKTSEDFETIAKEYSEGSTAEEGGRLGWLRQQDMIKEVAEVAMNQEVGVVSDIIESPLGYHIIFVHAQRGDEEKSVEMSQIIIRKKLFGQWIEQKMQGMRIFLPQRQYYWDEGEQKVTFSGQEMQSFEMRLRKSEDATLFGL